MFKKITVSAALSTTLIFGGIFATSVDASASTQSQPGQNDTTYYTLDVNQNLKSNRTMNDLFTQFYNNQDNNQEKHGGNQSDNTPEKTDEREQETQQQPKQHSNNTAQQTEQTQQQSSQASESALPALSQYEQQVVDLTNEKRADHGLSPLKVDKELSRVAREKSNDMMSNHYFDHNSPNYGSAFDMMKSYGISYSTAGENIAKGQSTPEAVVNGWMNSEGHRENILNENFTHIGVGYVEQGNHWTQQFIGK